MNLQAVVPTAKSRATVMHLWLPGFAPHDAVMCNGASPTGTAKAPRRAIPLAHAGTFLAGGRMRWCAPCVGKAAEHYGLLPHVASLVVDAARRA